MSSPDRDFAFELPSPALPVDRTRWTSAGSESGVRDIPEETAVALVHDASTTAVMMATPADLEDFAVGFSLSEGAIAGLADIRDMEVVIQPLGVEIRLWLTPAAGARITSRRRRIAGPTGCGLCGVDSLSEAVRPARRVDAAGPGLRSHEVLTAMAGLSESQPLGRRTRAMHAAALWSPEEGLIAVREDVGRHNALDKLIGARLRAGAADGSSGVVLLTSRVSVEMVQKTAALGATILCAVSAPTALAVRTAEEAGITLVAVARSDGFEVFTHPHRILT